MKYNVYDRTTGGIAYPDALAERLQALMASSTVQRVVITCRSYGQVLDIKVVPSNLLPASIDAWVPPGTTEVEVYP